MAGIGVATTTASVGSSGGVLVAGKDSRGGSGMVPVISSSGMASSEFSLVTSRVASSVVELAGVGRIHSTSGEETGIGLMISKGRGGVTVPLCFPELGAC